MTATELLTAPLAQAIGRALVHLLWQGAIVAAILAAVLTLLKDRSARARYAASCAALALLLVLGVATAWRVYEPAVPFTPAMTDAALAAPDATDGVVVRASVPFSLATWLPKIVLIWIAGVVLLSARLLMTWLRAHRLARRATRAASAEWQLIVSRLSDALQLRRAVRLLESAAVEVPSVIGWLRPVVLLPASALSGLAPEQIEMILAHELAHVRRHDFLVNLLQAVVETLLFYHPAVWWMSHRVRVERENCCDDLAVAVCGDALRYARALTRLEELRATPRIALAANGGSLLDRIKRIAGVPSEESGIGTRSAAAAAMLAVIATLVVAPSLPVFARAEEKPKAAKSKVDVTAPKAEQADDDADDDDIVIDVDPHVELTPEERARIEEHAKREALRIARSVAPRVHVRVPEIHVEIPEPPDVPMPPGVPTPAVTVYPAPPAMPGTPAPIAIAAPRVTIAAAPAPPAPGIPGVPGIPRTPRAPRVRIESSSRPGRLSVDDLIALKAMSVTPELIREYRAVLPDVAVHEIIALKALKATPQFIRELDDAGYDHLDAGEIIGLAAGGVDADFIRRVQKHKKEN